MPHSARGLFAGILAAALLSCIAFAPAQAAAAKMTKADKVALKQAIVACKAEARGKKIRWPKSRSYINNCVKEALKDRPNMGNIEVDIDHLPVLTVKDPM